MAPARSGRMCCPVLPPGATRLRQFNLSRGGRWGLQYRARTATHGTALGARLAGRADPTPQCKSTGGGAAPAIPCSPCFGSNATTPPAFLACCGHLGGHGLQFASCGSRWRHHGSMDVRHHVLQRTCRWAHKRRGLPCGMERHLADVEERNDRSGLPSVPCA